MKKYLKYILTGIVVLAAVIAVVLMVHHHAYNPRTRDGQVRAEIVQIAARVSGPIIHLPLKDNQFVNAGGSAVGNRSAHLRGRAGPGPRTV